MASQIVSVAANGQKTSNGLADGKLQRPVGHVRQLPAADGETPRDRAARAARVPAARCSKARSCSGVRKPSPRPTARRPPSTIRSPRPAATCCARAICRRSRAFAASRIRRQAQFPVADAGPVLRHGVAAAHSDSLLHGEGSGRRPQEHGRRHRQHRLLLRADAVPGPGGDDQRRARRDRHATWPPRCWPELRRVAVRDDLGDRLHHGAGHGQRADRRRQRRGGARPARRRAASRDDRSREGPRRQDRRRRGRRRSRSCWAFCSRR